VQERDTPVAEVTRRPEFDAELEAQDRIVDDGMDDHASAGLDSASLDVGESDKVSIPTG
jgi:hypothetical protein